MESNKKIACKVNVLADAAVYLSGLTFDEYYLNENAFEKYWEYGVKPLSLIFHEENAFVNLPGISCPPVSYAHVAALGARLHYPFDSEPNAERMFDSLDEGIGWLRRGHDFTANDLFKRYTAYTETLRNYLHDPRIKISGLGLEGPVTTAVLLRGLDFFIDIQEDPEKTKVFLSLVTDSIIAFRRFLNKINGEINGMHTVWLADDFAALINPALFGDFVVPYWNRYCEGISPFGRRVLHCEGLDQKHLQFLRTVKIDFFDPTISPKLSCRMLEDDLLIPFSWTLPSFYLCGMNEKTIYNWVEDALTLDNVKNAFNDNDDANVRKQGLECIITELDRNLLRNDGIGKVRSFINSFNNINN